MPINRTRLLAAAAVVAAALFTAPARARAEVGIGIFIGEPLGLTVKVDLSQKTALEFLIGVENDGRWDRDNGDDAYAHVTFLVQLAVLDAGSVLIPFRLGIGGSVSEGDDGRDYDDDIDLSVRGPFQVGFRFVEVPIEIYAEISLELELVDDPGDLELGAGIGFRFYF